MKDLLKTMLVLALFFASTFILLKLAGVLSLESIENGLQAIAHADPIVIALLIIGLLFADLLIAVPTLTICLFAGYFLGWLPGAIAISLGFYCAGISGYLISRRYGWPLIRKIYKAEERLEAMYEAFSRFGPTVLILCRAVPILPEVSSCMAGATGMPILRYLLLFSIGSIPYALLASYAGSISTIEDPKPAVMAAFVISLCLWLAWYVFMRRMNQAPST